MSRETNIRINFRMLKEALRAQELAAAMISVYRQNGRWFFPFAGMELQDAGGYLYHERRRVRYEDLNELRDMGDRYRKEYALQRRGVPDPRQTEKAEELIGHIRHEECLLEMHGADIPHARQISGYYFEDFFAMFCMILAATAPESPFEGMCRTVTDDHVKRILTHAVYDGKVLTFEQMEGSPVFDAEVMTWTVTEGRFAKNSYQCPCILVRILSENQEALKQDQELAGWIRQTNDVTTEMISAVLRCMCGNNTDVELYAGKRDVCVKYRDALLALLAEKDYAAKAVSILNKNECRGTHVLIPDSVTIIGNEAFRGKAGMQSIQIHDSVTSIGAFAFEDCISLKDIHIPDSVTAIGDFAFSGCSGLRTVTLPGKLAAISCGMFVGCDALEEVVIPGSVRLIGSFAFSQCENLTSIMIPESVTKIGADLFKDGNPGLTIYGKKGSVAARWAADNGLRFAER